MSLRDDFRNRPPYFLAAAVALLVDQASKIAAVAWLQGKGQDAVMPGFLNLWFSTNRGGRFGYFGNLGEPWREILLIGMPLLFVSGMVLFLARTDEPDRATLFGLAMMLGGATGNLIDRVPDRPPDEPTRRGSERAPLMSHPPPGARPGSSDASRLGTSVNAGARSSSGAGPADLLATVTELRERVAALSGATWSEAGTGRSA